MSAIFCTGEVSTGMAGEALCSTAWVSSDDWTVSELDPAMVASAFSAGFVLVGIAYALGHAIRIIISAVRR